MITVHQDIRQCLTLSGVRKNAGRCPTDADLGIVHDAAVAEEAGKVRWVGPKKDLPAEYASARKVSAGQAVWFPALVECHTHLVYGGSRVADYALRCQGKSYQEVAKLGGGILSTVKATRETAGEELIKRSLHELESFLNAGIGCIEIKSGYGLTLESEIKMLDCIRALQNQTAVRLVPTFLPAHAIPPEYKGKTEAMVDAICQEWIPEIARLKLARFFDAFVEDGYFNVAQTRKMAQVAKEHGLAIKLHVDQFTDQSGAALSVELGAASADHLEVVSSEGIAKLAKSKTVAVLAPGASVFTATEFAPARALLDAGARVALTTDFNPGTCPSHNLPLMVTLACAKMKMTLAEAVAAITYNAAAAVGLEEEFGSIEVGRPLNVTALPFQSFEEIGYRFGELPKGARLHLGKN